jgi:hypothetical protein
MRALVVTLAVLSNLVCASADPLGAWVVSFQDHKEATQRCDFSSARLWITEQSAVVSFDRERPPWFTKVVIDLKKLPSAELEVPLKGGETIKMVGSFGAGSGGGTWDAPARSCKGSWRAWRSMELPPPRLVEVKLQTTSGSCPEHWPPARIWFQGQIPIALDDAAEHAKLYRRVALLAGPGHGGAYLLEAADGEQLLVWWTSLWEARKNWESLTRDCRGTW